MKCETRPNPLRAVTVNVLAALPNGQAFMKNDYKCTKHAAGG